MLQVALLTIWMSLMVIAVFPLCLHLGYTVLLSSGQFDGHIHYAAWPDDGPQLILRLVALTHKFKS